MTTMLEITDANFAAEVEASKGTLLLDFWAPWCGPCRAMEPILKEIAAENPEFTIGKINVDENPAVTQRFDVMSIPTFVIFKDGQVAQRVTGGMPKAKLLSVLQSV
jgi:thioredoxin 1